MFGEKLKEFRKQKGLSQKELAEKVFVSQQTVYQWENGISYPQLDRLPSIAAALETSSLSLLHDDTQQTHSVIINYGKELAPNIEEFILSPNEYQICITEAKTELLLSDLEFATYCAWKEKNSESDVPFWSLMEYERCQNAVSGKNVADFLEIRAAWRQGGKEEVARYCALQQVPINPCLPKEFAIAYKYMLGLLSRKTLRKHAQRFESLKEYEKR